MRTPWSVPAEFVEGVDGRRWLVSCRSSDVDLVNAGAQPIDVLVGGSAWSLVVRWLLVVGAGILALALCLPAGAGAALSEIGGSVWAVFPVLFVVGVLVSARILLRRPHFVVAETTADPETGWPPETWTGDVAGFTAARRQVRKAHRLIVTRGTPARAGSPLSPL